jgi:hypothetical protein
MEKAVRDLVRQRAGDRCEYCRICQEHSPLSLQIEHIVACKHGGSDDPSNLAWACDRCNLHKGSDLSGIDPITKQVVQLFHPRLQSWPEHFALDGIEIIGLTACGPATVNVLRMNAPRRVRLRAALQKRGELDVE